MVDTISELVMKKLDKASGEIAEAKKKLAAPVDRATATELLKKARTRLTRTIELIADEPEED